MSTASGSEVATPRSSTVKGAAIAVVAATVVAAVLNTVISLVARGLGATSPGLTPAIYIFLTLVGVIIGAIGWVIVRNRSADPAALVRWLAPVVVVVSWIPDLLLGLAGQGWGGVVALMLMHPVVAVCAVVSYRRFLPLTPRSV